jgi:hypothetical protein
MNITERDERTDRSEGYGGEHHDREKRERSSYDMSRGGVWTAVAGQARETKYRPTGGVSREARYDREQERLAPRGSAAWAKPMQRERSRPAETMGGDESLSRVERLPYPIEASPRVPRRGDDEDWRYEVAIHEILRYLRKSLRSHAPRGLEGEQLINQLLTRCHVFHKPSLPLVPSEYGATYIASVLGSSPQSETEIKAILASIKLPLIRQLTVRVNADEEACHVLIRFNHNGLLSMTLSHRLLDSCQRRYPQHSRSRIIGSFLRYLSLGNTFDQCGLAPNLVRAIEERVPLTGELFSSFWNRVTPGVYYTMFPDLESDFGASGDYFSSTPSPGCYLANPPHDDYLIDRFLAKARHELQTILGLSYVVFLPSRVALPSWVGESLLLKGYPRLNYNPIYDTYQDERYRVLILSNQLSFPAREVLDAIQAWCEGRV